jgi:hypothetical protein
MRLGVTLSLTDEEVEKLRNDPSEQETQKLILNCLSQGRAKVDGNSYRPDREDHIWTHDEGLPGFECDLFSDDTLMLIKGILKNDAHFFGRSLAAAEQRLASISAALALTGHQELSHEILAMGGLMRRAYSEFCYELDN